jgi:cytochrome P450
MSIDDQLARLDHHDPEFGRDPYVVYSAMRERCPVAHSEAHGGYWLVAGYDDVAGILKDDYTFSSAQGVTFPSVVGANPVIPIEVDPPEFFKFRRMLNPWFSPARIASWEPAVREITTSLLDGVAAAGEIDFVQDFGRLLPGIVTLRFIGLPEKDVVQWLDWIHQLLHFSIDDPESTVRVGLQCYGAMWQEMSRRREAGETHQDDLLGFLLHTEVEGGRRLLDEQIMGIVFLMLFGGLDTTGAAISNALWYLDHHHGDRRKLAEDFSLIPDAVEEFLRYEAPVQGLHRVVVKDTVIGGCPVSAGEHLYFLMGSANRDEREFDDADSVILDRKPNRHLSFGVGAHRCLGSHLGRLQFRVALEEILTRMPDFRLDRENCHRWADVGIVCGFTNLPATFAPSGPA